jgi:hypothetical protein
VQTRHFPSGFLEVIKIVKNEILETLTKNQNGKTIPVTGRGGP